MPTAKKLPSGSWRCQVYSHTESTLLPDGTTKKKRIYKSFTCDIKGPKGKRIAERMAAEWADEKEVSDANLDITFGEAADRYIDSRKSVLSPRTIMDYKRIRKHDLQSLMSKPLFHLTQHDVQTAIDLDAQKHSPKTVRNNHGFVSAVLKEFRPNFALSTQLPKKIRPNLYVPNDQDVKTLMRSVAGTEMEIPILLAAFGPMRRGEICALSADNINGNTVHVYLNMVRDENNNWIIKAPKSYAGDRYILFPDFVIDKLKNQSGRITDLYPDDITNKFKYVLKRAGLPHFRFHDLRHYSASIQHALGIPDSYIMQRGGWGNDAVLKEVYRHTLDDRTVQMNAVANEHFSELCDTKCNTDMKKAL